MRISDWSSDVCSSDLDVRPQLRRSAVTAYRSKRRVAFPFHRIATCRTQGGLQLAMHMQHPLRPGSFMPVVDILRNDQQFAPPCRVQSGSCLMCRTRPDVMHLCPPPVIAATHQCGFTPTCYGSSQTLHALPFPTPPHP